MHTETVSYQKTFPLQGYSNEKIGVEIKLQSGEDPLQAFADAKLIVEKSHKFFQDLPTYEKAKKIIANPLDYTGRDVEQSKQVIEVFESNYPDYLQKFSVTRELEVGKEPSPYYEHEEEE